MLDVNVLGITRDIKLKILENITLSEIGLCAHNASVFCTIYDCTDGVLMNDLFTLNVMVQFSHYMNTYTFDWMPICYVDFRTNLEREIENIENNIKSMWTCEFYVD